MSSIKFSKLITLHSVKAKPSYGFTLIELLIVMAIIAVLVGIGAVSYSQVQNRSMDTQRKSDLKKIAGALESYHGDNSEYPQTAGTGQINCGNPLVTLAWGNPFVCISGGISKTYLNELPDDPSPANNYYYEARNVSSVSGCIGGACQRYVLAAILENANDPDSNDTACLLPADRYDYCLTSP